VSALQYAFVAMLIFAIKEIDLVDLNDFLRVTLGRARRNTNWRSQNGLRGHYPEPQTFER
jgi:hypothetical protein